MKLINLNSKKGVLNLFADYILKNIDSKLNTVIQVTDCNHFLIINGVTQSNNVLDLQSIKDKFISEYETLLTDVGYTKNISIMDLIHYNKNIVESEDRYLWTTFYNSERPIYHQDMITVYGSDKDYYSMSYDDGIVYELDYNIVTRPSKFTITPFQFTSEFPHGFSLSMGRSLFYYSEYVVNQIMKPSMANKIDMLITNKKNEDGEQIIDFKFDSLISEDTIKSMVLDIFSFDFNEFEKLIEGYDLCDDIKKPTESKPWLVIDKHPNDLLVF